MYSIGILVILGVAIPKKAPWGSLQIKDYQITYLLYVEDHATIFFWQGIALPLFVFWDNCEFHPFKICKIVRIEEPIVGLWEKWWDCVTQSETVWVERSGFSFNISGNLDTSFWLLRDHMSGNKAHSFCLVCSYIMHPVHMWFLAS